MNLSEWSWAPYLPITPAFNKKVSVQIHNSARHRGSQREHPNGRHTSCRHGWAIRWGSRWLEACHGWCQWHAHIWQTYQASRPIAQHRDWRIRVEIPARASSSILVFVLPSISGGSIVKHNTSVVHRRAVLGEIGVRRWHFGSWIDSRHPSRVCHTVSIHHVLPPLNIVIWDNWHILHKLESLIPGVPRVMHRTTTARWCARDCRQTWSGFTKLSSSIDWFIYHRCFMYGSWSEDPHLFCKLQRPVYNETQVWWESYTDLTYRRVLLIYFFLCAQGY